MKVLHYEQLSKVILDFACNGRPVLFTGAGVGKKVDFPLWQEYLSGLADVCAEHGDEDSANLMRKKLAAGHLVGAAGVYEDCQDIPIGERWKKLAAPFRAEIPKEKLELLYPLFALPFGGVVTTNYDHSQHDAFSHAKRRAPVQIELEGKSMLGGADQTSFFIARIHGSAELPSSMVLYPGSYKDLTKNGLYSDFLINLFRDRPCLFVGFSFVDPAIEHVLATYRERRQQLFETPHAALLPSDASPDIHRRLSELNIKASFYDAADGHAALWKAFRKAAADYERSKCQAKTGGKAAAVPARPAFQHFLAFTYAQMKLASEAQPVLEQARDAIVLSIVRDGGRAGIATQALLATLRDVLSLDDKETEAVIRESRARLHAGNEIRIEGDRLIAIAGECNEIAEPMEVLVRGILDRLKVRENFAPTEKDRHVAVHAIEQSLMVRAWDLAAHWAGGGAGYGENLYATVHEIVLKLTPDFSEKRQLAMERCAIDLLTLPTEDEAEHLAELSRAAFSLQMVLSSPRQALFQEYVLPQRVYFDASVLLPAVVPGHPLSSLYMGAIRRLKEAATRAGIKLELCVGAPFLNEVMSHREKAVTIANDLKLDDSKNLERLISFYGAENTNVFIGAFAGRVGAASIDGRARQSFQQFLQQVAPYTSEDGLNGFLAKIGFVVVPMDFRKDHNKEFVTYFNGLLGSYERLADDMIRGKEKILVEHEAKQIVQLHLDRQDGLRSVFVTNDRKLRRAAMNQTSTRHCVDFMLPPEGFIGLIDIIVGIKADRRGLARLIWAAPRREADRAIRDYFVRRALEERDAAMVKAIPKVIEEIVASATESLEKKPINISDGNNPDSVTETAHFIDRFEREFYEKMVRVVEKAERNS